MVASLTGPHADDGHGDPGGRDTDPVARAALDTLLATLSAEPDELDSPVVVDATDRLILDHATADIVAAGPGRVVVVDDRLGALTLGAAALLGADPHVRVHQDAITAERELAHRAEALGLRATYRPCDLGPGLLDGARLVLLQLPRSLAALREIAEHVARDADPDVVLVAGGRVKHMTHAMNDVLSECFDDVRATRARAKSRLLVARLPRGLSRVTYPVSGTIPDLRLGVWAFGAAFAGAGLDLGTRFLVEQLDAHTPATPGVVVDLGCGTGLLATWAARRWPGAHVIAADRSTAAVRSTALTAEANGVGSRVRVVRDDAGESLDDASADLVLLNPPFHDGAALRTDTALRMFATTARVLRPGGELWCVWNSHLRYRPALERVVGPTAQVARNPKFTVTRSVRHSSATG